MSSCSRCGNPVEFRYVNGRCIPIHLYGGCIAGDSSAANDYSGHNVSHESTCFSTNCPECGEEVFFIRHNGGSIWIDPPLGYPWYKHSCFDKPTEVTSKTSLVTTYGISLKAKSEEESNLVIGVVKSTDVDWSKDYTDIILETGRDGSKKIRIKNNAGFLLGKLCIYDISENDIWPVAEPSYKFITYNNNDLVQCPKCGEEAFFIRHNGGSVWIDPPLEYPWYKHSCFDKPTEVTSKTSLVTTYGIPLKTKSEEESNLVIGVVKSTDVDWSKNYTDIILEIGGNGSKKIRTKSNAGFLLGKLCVYDISENDIWPVAEPSYKFTIYNNSLVKCPECNAMLKPKNMTKHLSKQHAHS